MRVLGRSEKLTAREFESFEIEKRHDTKTLDALINDRKIARTCTVVSRVS